MPFACSVQDGRVVMAPAPEQSYRILGRHEQQQFTACPPGSPDRCTTWMLHRFDIPCGGIRVAWMHAVAAAMQRIDSRVMVDQGRLNIPLREATVAAACGSESGTPGANSTATRRAPERFCGPPLSADATVPLPIGFAPVMRLGARFVSGTSPAAGATPPAARDGSTSLIIKVADTGNAQAVHQQGSTAVSRAGTELAGGEVILTGWMAQTRAEPRGDSMAARLRLAVSDPGASQGLTYWVMIVTTLMILSSAAAMAWLKQQKDYRPALAEIMQWIGSLFRRSQSAGDQSAATESAQRCAELIRAADRLHQIVRAAVGDLGAQPLREVLERELAGIEAALMSPELTRHSAARRWDKVEAQMRNVRRDLERVHRIATSAGTLPPGMRNPDAMPKTQAEAREVLGVSAVAGERIVKKVVDALRQSWHPDHAADAEDRRAREQRLKQINVAWDLINRSQEKAA